MAFNKQDIIAKMAESAEIKKAEAGKAFDAFLEMLAEDEVTVTGYFATKVKEVEERECRNPQTGGTITVPAHNALRFKVGKKLKDAFNQ